MSPLKAQSFLRLVAEVRDSKDQKDLKCHYCLEDGGKNWKRPESDSLLIASKTRDHSSKVLDSDNN